MARKAVLKRIKFTKNGKMLRRPSGQNHFNAKASRKSQLKQKGVIHLYPALAKNFRAYAA